MIEMTLFPRQTPIKAQLRVGNASMALPRRCSVDGGRQTKTHGKHVWEGSLPATYRLEVEKPDNE